MGRVLTQNVALTDEHGNPIWYGPAYGNAEVPDDVAARIGDHAFVELDERGEPKPAAPTVEEPVIEPADVKPLEDRSKAELVDLADANGVDSSGTKAEVLERLQAAGIET